MFLAIYIKWGLLAKLLKRALFWHLWILGTLKLDSILSLHKCAMSLARKIVKLKSSANSTFFVDINCPDLSHKLTPPSSVRQMNHVLVQLKPENKVWFVNPRGHTMNRKRELAFSPSAYFGLLSLASSTWTSTTAEPERALGLPLSVATTWKRWCFMCS